MFKYNCFNLPATMVEEGVRDKTPSPFEISIPAEPCQQHTQTPRIATLNVTHTNIERHAKIAKTARETLFRNKNKARNRHRKA
jgi:hypothetical protein